MKLKKMNVVPYACNPYLVYSRPKQNKIFLLTSRSMTIEMSTSKKNMTASKLVRESGSFNRSRTSKLRLTHSTHLVNIYLCTVYKSKTKGYKNAVYKGKQ